VLADRFDGKRFNSPNDVIVKSDGSVWFTDPGFGIESDYEGERQTPEMPERVYRIDPSSGALACVADDLLGPNGLAFSPDESILYIVESKARPRTIRAYDVAADGRSLRNGRTLIDAQAGTPDGFRVDVHGNLWCGWGMGSDELDGVRVFTPEGEAIGHIALPERCANVCFGGRHHNRLFMAASHGLYSLFVNTQGAAGG
jgi:gluconolactonase